MKAVKIDAETLGLQDSFYYKDFIKRELTGAKWVKDQKIWKIEFSISNIEKLKTIKCEIADDVEVQYKKVKKVMDQVIAEKLSEKIKAIEKMPIKATPYEHQVKAFNIACKIMNLFKEGDK